MPSRSGRPEPERQQRAPRDYSFASASLRAHLVRGAVGFGLLLLGWQLLPRVGAVAWGPVALGVLALAGVSDLLDDRPRPDRGAPALPAGVHRRRHLCAGRRQRIEPRSGIGTVSR